MRKRRKAAARSDTKSDGRPRALEFIRLKVSDLKPHPRNYRKHPPDQLAHIERSIEEHGFYRNVVVARDGTVLAGHGVVEAARRMGIEEVPGVCLDLAPDDPRALKLIAGDNEIARGAEVDDRALTELLREIMGSDAAALIGTGYDQAQLAALLMVTRTRDEIAGTDAAAHWVGMPEYGTGESTIALVVQFRDVHDRDRFLKAAALDPDRCRVQKNGKVWSTWWPERKRDDRNAVKFVQEAAP